MAYIIAAMQLYYNFTMVVLPTSFLSLFVNTCIKYARWARNFLSVSLSAKNNELPKLEFDHDEMVSEALHTMRGQLYHYPIGINMLPEKFTLSEIHALYETLPGKKLDVSNFPKKLIALGLLKKLGEKRSIGPHNLFDKEKYSQALKDGVVLS